MILCFYKYYGVYLLVICIPHNFRPAQSYLPYMSILQLHIDTDSLQALTQSVNVGPDTNGQHTWHNCAHETLETTKKKHNN